MAKDISIDIKSHDILFQDVTDRKSIIYQSQWGNVIEGDAYDNVALLNILVPLIYQRKIKYDGNDNLDVIVNVAYYPQIKPIKVRFLTYNVEGDIVAYSGCVKNGVYDISCLSDNNNINSKPNATELPLINVDGLFAIRFNKNSDTVCIYSASQSDIDIATSDNQSSQLMMLNASGDYYRYPISGVGIYNYLNSVIAHSDLADKLVSEMGGEKRNVYDASFESETGIFSIVTSEEITEKDEELEDVSALELDEVGAITGNDFSSIIEISGGTSTGSTGNTGSSSGSGSSGSGGSSSGSTGSIGGSGLSSLVYDSIELLTAVTLLDKEYKLMLDEEKTRIQNELNRIAVESNRELAEVRRNQAEREREAQFAAFLSEANNSVNALKAEYEALKAKLESQYNKSETQYVKMEGEYAKMEELRLYVDSQMPRYVYEDEWALMTNEQKKGKLWYVLKGTRAEADSEDVVQWALGCTLPITLGDSRWMLGDKLPLTLGEAAAWCLGNKLPIEL